MPGDAPDVDQGRGQTSKLLFAGARAPQSRGGGGASQPSSSSSSSWSPCGGRRRARAARARTTPAGSRELPQHGAVAAGTSTQRERVFESSLCLRWPRAHLRAMSRGVAVYLFSLPQRRMTHTDGTHIKPL